MHAGSPTAIVRPAPQVEEPDPAFARYAEGFDVNWSEDLEALHEESSRDHFLDVWTRSALLESVVPQTAPDGVVVDAGCSSGYLLEDLRDALPDAQLIGVDLVASGLRTAHELVPEATLLLADVCDLPVIDGSVDAVVSANLLEHVSDDERALREFHRILAPGGRAAIVVPAGPGTYDYYDRFLDHERRYARHELAGKAGRAGFRVLHDGYIGSLIYPAFWAVKKLNRRRHPNPDPAEMQELVRANIAKTEQARLGEFTALIERRLARRNVGLPFGIRSFVVLERS